MIKRGKACAPFDRQLDQVRQVGQVRKKGSMKERV